MKGLSSFYTTLRALIVGWLLSAPGSTSAQSVDPADESTWNQAKRLSTVEAFEDYLARYPAGQHASEAFRCIVELIVEATEGECAPPSPPAAGATRGLSSVDVY